MNVLNLSSFGIVRSSGTNVDPFLQLSGYAKNFSLLLSGTSGNTFAGNVTGNGYSTSAWGLNVSGNTSFLTVTNGNTFAKSTDFGSPEVSIYAKYSCRFNQAAVVERFGITVSTNAIGQGGSFTVSFYSLNPLMSYPYTITNVNQSDVSGALTGNFVGPYQTMTFTTSATISLGTNITITCGNAVQVLIAVLYVAGAISTNMAGPNKFPHLTTSNTNTLFYSSNGTNWIGLGQTIFDLGCLSVVYGNGIWVAGGIGSTNDMAYSTDGIHWTGLGIMFSAGENYNSNLLPYNYKGLNPDPPSALKAFGGGCTNVTFLGGYFFAVGTGSVAYTSVFVYSTDGINWSRYSFLNTLQNQNRYLSPTTFATVFDGVQWTVFGYDCTFVSAVGDPTTWTITEQFFDNNSSWGAGDFVGSITFMGYAGTPGPGGNYYMRQSSGACIPIYGSYQSMVLVVAQNKFVDYFLTTPANLASSATLSVYNGIPEQGTQGVFFSANIYLPNQTKIYNVYDLTFDTAMQKWILVGDQGIMTKDTNSFSSAQVDCAFSILAAPASAYIYGLGCRNKGKRNFAVKSSVANYVVGTMLASMTGAGKIPLTTENVTCMYFSADAITWFPCKNVFDFCCTSIAYNPTGPYGNGYWVAGGITLYGGYDTAYSRDGINWSGLGQFFSSSYNPSGPYVFYSQMGKPESSTGIKVSAHGCHTVKYLGGWFLAGGFDAYVNAGFLWVSHSGAYWDWRRTNIQTNSAIQTITFDGSFFYAFSSTEVWKSVQYNSDYLTDWKQKVSGVGHFGEVVSVSQPFQNQLMTSQSTFSYIDTSFLTENINAPWRTGPDKLLDNCFVLFAGNGSTVVGVTFVPVDYVSVLPIATAVLWVYTNSILTGSYSIYLSNQPIYNIHDIQYDTLSSKWILVGDQGVMAKDTQIFSSARADCNVTLLSRPGKYIWALACNSGTRTFLDPTLTLLSTIINIVPNGNGKYTVMAVPKDPQYPTMSRTFPVYSAAQIVNQPTPLFTGLSSIFAMAFSKNGIFLANTSQIFYSLLNDGVWSPLTQIACNILNYNQTETFTGITVTADGSRVVVCGQNIYMSLWNGTSYNTLQVMTNATVGTGTNTFSYHCVDMMADGSRLLFSYAQYVYYSDWKGFYTPPVLVDTIPGNNPYTYPAIDVAITRSGSRCVYIAYRPETSTSVLYVTSAWNGTYYPTNPAVSTQYVYSTARFSLDENFIFLAPYPLLPDRTPNTNYLNQFGVLSLDVSSNLYKNIVSYTVSLSNETLGVGLGGAGTYAFEISADGNSLYYISNGAGSNTLYQFPISYTVPTQTFKYTGYLGGYNTGYKISYTYG